MRPRFIFLLAIYCVSSIVLARSNCTSQITREIEACTKKNAQESDDALNKEYTYLMRKFSADDRRLLLETQRYWIAYRDQYCQAAFDATSPGEEAGIDKWSCIDEITSTRTQELRYIDSSYTMKDFRSALRIMADQYEHGDLEKVINKLDKGVSGSSDPVWLKYVSANCEMTKKKLGEENNVCVARMNFYKNW